MQNKKSETHSAKQTSSKPDKEVIKKNSEKQRSDQSKKDTKEKQVEHNYDKEQE